MYISKGVMYFLLKSLGLVGEVTRYSPTMKVHLNERVAYHAFFFV